MVETQLDFNNRAALLTPTGYKEYSVKLNVVEQ